MVRQDRVERRGEDEPRAPLLPGRQHAAIRGFVAPQEPRERLRFDVDGGASRNALEHLLDRAVCVQHRVRPVPPGNPLPANPERDRRAPLLEPRRLQGVGLAPPHEVARLVPVEVERERRQRLTPCPTIGGPRRGTGHRAPRATRATPCPRARGRSSSPCGSSPPTGRTSPRASGRARSRSPSPPRS